MFMCFSTSYPLQAKDNTGLQRAEKSLKSMQTTIDKIHNEKNPQKKQKLMQEYMGNMQSHMTMMSQMFKSMSGNDHHMMGKMGEM